MKINWNRKSQKGFTLMEVTLVIAVLLGLNSILFVGLSAFKDGRDRAECIITMATTQKAVRSHQNLQGMREGDALSINDIVGPEKMLENMISCPSPGGSYTFETEIPTYGVPYVTCSLAGLQKHAPKSTSSW